MVLRCDITHHACEGKGTLVPLWKHFWTSFVEYGIVHVLSFSKVCLIRGLHDLAFRFEFRFDKEDVVGLFPFHLGDSFVSVVPLYEDVNLGVPLPRWRCMSASGTSMLRKECV